MLRVVLADKNYAEIKAVESVKVILRKMHVLNAFRRTFKGHEKRDELRDLLQTIR